MAAVVQPLPHVDAQLDDILRAIPTIYTKENSKKVIGFTKRTLGGEFLKFPEDDITRCLKELRNQGRITPKNTSYLEFFAKEDKGIKEKIAMLKSQSVQEKEKRSEFIGREADVRAVVDYLTTDTTRIMTLHGVPGVGKTTLADEVVNILEAKGKVASKRNIDLRKIKSQNVFCRAVLNAFGSKKILKPCIEFVHEEIESLEKSAILVLDNAEDVISQHSLQGSSVSFMQTLKSMTEHDKSRKLTVLLTSRIPLPDEMNGCVSYEVMPLDVVKSASILENFNISLSSEEKNKISHLCENKPLLLKVVAGLMEENLFSKENIDQLKNLIISKAFENFMPEMKKATIKLSLFQGVFTIKDAKKMICQPKDETLFYLNTLTERKFLTRIDDKDKGPEVYKMHPSINEFMVSQFENEALKDIVTDAKETFFKNYLKKSRQIAQLLDKDYVRAYSVIEKERLNMKLAIDISFERGFLYFSDDFSESSILADLFLILIPGLEREKLFREWSTIAEEKGKWLCYSILGCMHVTVLLERTAGKSQARQSLGKVQEALDKLDDKSSDAYRLAESSFLYAKGEMLYSECESKGSDVCTKAKWKEVLNLYQQSLKIREELLEDHTDTARTLNAIGNCCMYLDEIERARQYYTRALEMRRRLSGSQLHVDMPVYINQIAATHELMGKDYQRQADEANLYYRKAFAEKSRQEFNSALGKYQEALDLEKKLHISGYINTATFYRNMSNTYSFLEDYESSLRTAKKALFVRKKLLGIDSDTIRSYYQVGLAYEKLEDINKALKYFYKAYMMEQALPEGETSPVRDRVLRKIETHDGSVEEAELEDRRHKQVLEKGSADDDGVLTSADEEEEEEEEKEEKGSLKEAREEELWEESSSSSSSSSGVNDYDTVLDVKVPDAEPPGTTVQTTDEGPPRTTVQTTDEGPLGTTVHQKTDEGPPRTTVQTTDEGPPGTTVQTTDEGLPGTTVQTTDEGPPGTTVQTTDEGPPRTTVQTTDEGPLGTTVHQKTDEGPPRTTVQTTDEGPPGTTVQTTDEGPPGTTVQTTDEGLPGTTVQTTDEGPPGTTVQTTDEGLPGTSVQTTDEGPSVISHELADSEIEDVVSDRQVIGTESLEWNIEETGVRILFLPGTVPSDTSISCRVSKEPAMRLPLEPTETLVSLVVRLDADKPVFDREIGLLIPHCGAMKTKGYEETVKEFEETSGSWKEMADFINIQHKSDLQNIASEFTALIQPGKIKLPAVLLTTKNCSTVCVACRLVKDVLIARPAGSTHVSSVFPDVQLVFEKNSVRKNMAVDMKVHPLPDFTVFNSPNLSCSPVLYLETSQTKSIDILKPVRITLPHPLAWWNNFNEDDTRCGQVRVLYNERSDGSSMDQWQDITDDPETHLTVMGQKVSFHVRHFSMFWLICISDVEEEVQKLLNKAKSQFAKICAFSPFGVTFCVKCRPRIRKGQAILCYTALPLKDSKRSSNADEELYDGEEIQIDLDGPILQKRIGSDDSVFNIIFSSKRRKQKPMPVEVEDEDAIFNSLFLRVLANKRCICKIPLELPLVPQAIADLKPLEFYGIPLEDPSNKWKLLEPPLDVLLKIISITRSSLPSCPPKIIDSLTAVAEEAYKIKGSDKDSFKFFFERVSHTEMQQFAFDALVLNLKENAAHVKHVLQAGKKVVEEPLDRKTAKSLSEHIKEDYIKLAEVTDLSDKCEHIKKMKGTTTARCYIFLQAWIPRKPTLHLLMQKLREVGCEKGMKALLREFEDRLEERMRQEVFGPESGDTQATVAGHYQKVSTAEPLLAGQDIDNQRSSEVVQDSHGIVCPTDPFTEKPNTHEVFVAENNDSSIGASTTNDVDDEMLYSEDTSASGESPDISRDIIDEQTSTSVSLFSPGVWLIALSLGFIYFRYIRR